MVVKKREMVAIVDRMVVDAVFTGSYGASQAVFSVMIFCSAGSTFSFWMAMKHYRGDALD